MKYKIKLGRKLKKSSIKFLRELKYYNEDFFNFLSTEKKICDRLNCEDIPFNSVDCFEYKIIKK